ncbi:MAG: response regulator [Magnetococcus sp. MYC-9]
MKSRFGTIVQYVRQQLPNLEMLLFFSHRSVAYRLAIATLVVLVAWALREAMGPPELGVPFLTFFPAAAISALLGGFWAGMLTASLGACIATYYYIPPYQTLPFLFSPSTIFGNLVYLSDELIVCAAMSTLHHYYLRARQQYFEMHTLLHAVPEMIWMKNPDGIYMKCNSAFERLLGRPQAEILGRNDRQLFGESVARTLRTLDLAAASAPGPVIDEAWVPSAERTQPILRETIKTAIRADDGRLIGVLGIGRDITERREMEQTLLHHQQDLERLVTERTEQVLLLNTELESLAAKAVAANQAKSLFLANMSHEIRTPLNAILGFAYILNAAQLEAEHRDFVEKIQKSGRALLGIINDVLDFSKIEAGRMELHHTPFYLGAMLEDLAVLMAGNVGHKEVELIVGLEPDVPDALLGDPLRLLQILTNLTSNAIKFTDRGHVALQVQRVGQQADRIVLCFEVQDTGIGIEPEVLERLFTPFTQADDSTTRRFGGTGLGLAISKRLAELMGGELGASSTLGVGSRFWLTVPLAVAVAQSAAAQNPSPVKVLIADDHDLQREVLATTARSLGWQTETVASGDAVLERMRELHTFDAILLDWKMPGLDGLATSNRLLSDPDCPLSPIILMVTAHDQDSLRQQPGTSEIDAILAKPVTPSVLFNAFINARAKRGHVCDDWVTQGRRGAQGYRLAEVRILVVDDSEINLDVARRILELEGARVTTACQGQESLDLLRASPEAFDLVLMDVQMPVMDGNEAVRAIREELHLTALPVVALTAGALDSERQRALAAGMNDFIAKPFDVEKMLRTLRDLLGWNRPGAMPATSDDPPLSSSAWPTIAGIDQEVQTRLGGDRALFLSMLRRLLDEFHDMARDVEQDLAAHDSPKAAMRLHKLRGVAGNLGAREINRMAGELESLLRTRPDEALSDRLLLLDRALQSLAHAAAPYMVVPTPPAAESSNPPPLEPETLSMLMTALEQQSFEAIALFDACAPALSACWGEKEVALLAEAIGGLRFDEASKRLATLSAMSDPCQ